MERRPFGIALAVEIEGGRRRILVHLALAPIVQAHPACVIIRRGCGLDVKRHRRLIYADIGAKIHYAPRTVRRHVQSRWTEMSLTVAQIERPNDV